MMRRGKAVVFALLFAISAAGGVLMTPSGAPAMQQPIKGCWYMPPYPPACDICGGSCSAGQNCCTIIET